MKLICTKALNTMCGLLHSMETSWEMLMRMQRKNLKRWSLSNLPILFNACGQFCRVAEIVGSVDFNKDTDFE